MDSQVKYVYNSDLEVIKSEFNGNITIKGRYYNTNAIEKAPVLDVLKWKLSKNPQKKEKSLDTFKVNIITQLKNLKSTEDCIIWLGHACFYIQLNGVSILTDPCFYNVGYIKREFNLPFSICKLPDIDYILLSHSHRDHFDYASLSEIVKHSPKVEVLMPLSTQHLLQKKKNLSTLKYQEAGWYQKFHTTNQVEIFFLPAWHWNRRGLFDYNRALWGSFMIKASGKHIYFGGDTGFSAHFKDINKLFPKVDVCILPVGAYKPQFLMKHEHLSPSEARQAFNILGGKWFIPMHYGTYDISDEPLGEPVKLLNDMKSNYNAPIEILSAGEKFNF